MKKHKKFIPIGIIIYVLLIAYLSGMMTESTQNLFSSDKKMSYNPFVVWKYAFFTNNGIKTTVFMFFFILIVFLVLRIYSYSQKGKLDPERNFEYSEKDTYGTSGWMTDEEREQALDLLPVEKTYGTILGAIGEDVVSVVPTIRKENEDKFTDAQKAKQWRTNKHVCILGASGSMKSRAYVRNAIFQCVRRGESLIITDPKGEMYEDMAELLRDEGYKVQVFNLKDQIYSDSWACLEEVGTDEIMAQVFCSVIIQNTSNGKGDHFWDNAETNLLKALVLYVCIEYRKSGLPVTMAEVYKLLTTKTAAELALMFNALPKTHPAFVPYSIYAQAGENTRGSVIIGLGSRLQVFQSQVTKEITSYHELDLVEPGKRKCAYFCAMSDQDSTFTFLSSLFFSFLFIKLVKYADNFGKIPGKLDVPVNFILDEFANIGLIPDFEKKISTVRSRDINISVIIQNIPQLKSRYPNDVWQEIIGNCDTQLFLGCTDETTAKYISDRSGVATIDITSQAVQKKTMTPFQIIPEVKETQSVGKRNILTQDEVLRLPGKNALVIIRGEKILKVDKYDYSRHPYKKKMRPCRMSERVPEWRKRMLEEEEALNNPPTSSSFEDPEEFNVDTSFLPSELEPPLDENIKDYEVPISYPSPVNEQKIEQSWQESEKPLDAPKEPKRKKKNKKDKLSDLSEKPKISEKSDDNNVVLSNSSNNNAPLKDLEEKRQNEAPTPGSGASSDSHASSVAPRKSYILGKSKQTPKQDVAPVSTASYAMTDVKPTASVTYKPNKNNKANKVNKENSSKDELRNMSVDIDDSLF